MSQQAHLKSSPLPQAGRPFKHNVFLRGLTHDIFFPNRKEPSLPLPTKRKKKAVICSHMMLTPLGKRQREINVPYNAGENEHKIKR